MNTERNPTRSAIGKSFSGLEPAFSYLILLIALLFGDPGSFTASFGILAVIASLGLYLNFIGLRGSKEIENMDTAEFSQLIQEPECKTIANPESAYKLLSLLSISIYSGSSSLVMFTLIFGGIFYYFISEYKDDLYKVLFDKDYLPYRESTPMWFPNQVVLYEPNFARTKKGLNIHRTFATVSSAVVVLLALFG